MNDSIYEEYMRSVLGYQPMTLNNTYEMSYNDFEMPSMTAMNTLQMNELENCYPDIYKIVYPVVQRICTQNTMPVNRQLIDSMTEQVHSIIEDREIEENRNKENTSTKTTNTKTENRQVERNTGLNDLIRILILRELLGRPGFPGFPGQGGRPPRPRPPRPPMRPPIGQPRPPMRPQPRPGEGPFNRYSYDMYEEGYDL